jgi:ribonucleoside-diphosphate reductase alpha chain
MYKPEGMSEIIFRERYAAHKAETWEEACERVATAIARTEQNGKFIEYKERFYNVLVNGEFCPGGRILAGAGKPKQQLLNCFVLPAEDSREGWGKVLSDMIIVSGLGGGVGINGSEIRPRGSAIKGTGGHATGPVSLFDVINSAGEVVKAGGGRRTALMLCLDMAHPDVIEFIDKKFTKVKLDHRGAEGTSSFLKSEFGLYSLPKHMEDSLGELCAKDSPDWKIFIQQLADLFLQRNLKNANISVVFSTDPEIFFSKVKNDEMWELAWRGEVISTIKARDLWNKIIENFLDGGEPGILNGYLANKMNNIHYYKPLISVNPCGEQWLNENSACCLGSLVLPRLLNVSKTDFDWEKLSETITVAVRFLDNVLTVNNYPLPSIAQDCQEIRRIGLGIMGLHDALLMIGLKYSSDDGLEKIDNLLNFIKNKAYEASTYLAVEKGSFPKLERDLFLKSGFTKSLKKSVRSKIKEYGIRNCCVLTIAPTGTTSILMGSMSSGVEPIYAPAWYRMYFSNTEGATNSKKRELVFHPLFLEMFKAGKDLSHFECSSTIPPEGHMKVQQICQKHIDSAVSKTINIPNEGFSLEEFSDLLMKYVPHLKGVTVYKAGSRAEEPLQSISAEEAVKLLQESEEVLSEIDAEQLIAQACPNGICSI